MVISVVSLVFSMLIIRSTVRSIRKYPQLSKAARFPMLLSICDVGFHIFRTMSTFYIEFNFANESKMDKFYFDKDNQINEPDYYKDLNVISYYFNICTISASLSTFFTNLLSMLHIIICIYQFRVIFTEREPIYGAYYYKLLLYVLTLPLILLIYGLVIRAYGMQCGRSNICENCGIYSPINESIIHDGLIIIAILLIIYFYSRIFHKLSNHVKSMKSPLVSLHLQESSRLAKIQKVTLSLPLFVLVYVFVWLPSLFKNVYIDVNDSYLLTLWFAISTSSSGLLNGLAFHRLCRNQRNSTVQVESL